MLKNPKVKITCHCRNLAFSENGLKVLLEIWIIFELKYLSVLSRTWTFEGCWFYQIIMAYINKTELKLSAQKQPDRLTYHLISAPASRPTRPTATAQFSRKAPPHILRELSCWHTIALRLYFLHHKVMSYQYQHRRATLDRHRFSRRPRKSPPGNPSRYFIFIIIF